MSCTHAHSTTIAWMAGEADESHEFHVAECAECQHVLEEHEEVLFAITQAPGVLGRARATAARNKWWLSGGLAVALAAVFSVVVLVPDNTAEVLPIPTHSAEVTADWVGEDEDDWFEDWDDIEEEIDQIIDSIDAF